MESLQQCIDAVKDYCREHLVETTYNIFIKDIRAKSMTGTTAVLEVPSSFQKTSAISSCSAKPLRPCWAFRST